MEPAFVYLSGSTDTSLSAFTSQRFKKGSVRLCACVGVLFFLLRGTSGAQDINRNAVKKNKKKCGCEETERDGESRRFKARTKKEGGEGGGEGRKKSQKEH